MKKQVEIVSRRALTLVGIFSLALAQSGFTGGSCGGTDTEERQHLVVPDRPLCSDLDELECLARPDCLPSYLETDCACAPTGETDPAGRPFCDCPPPAFAGCEARPTSLICEQITDEASCAARSDCEVIQVGCACAAPSEDGFRAPCDCQEGFGGCATKVVHGGCEALDEQSCSANPACEAEFGPLPCPAIACAEGEDCSIRCEGFGFVGCHDRGCGECQPVTCEMYCEFGFQRDVKGCEVCACNPPPTGACSDLGEDACLSDARCEAVYDAGGACACPACIPGEECPPCDCAPIAPKFAYCIDRRVSDRCEVLDERSCNAEPSCEAEYLYPPCAYCDPAEGVECGVCEPIFSGCHTRESCAPVLCDMYCEFGFQTDPNGCEVCACNPPPSECAGLTEDQCTSIDACTPVYETTPCACEACDPNSDRPCYPCECPVNNVYAGCQEKTPDLCSTIRCEAGTECKACPPDVDCVVMCAPIGG